MKKNYNIAIARLSKEYEKIRKNPPKNFYAVPDKKNIFSWHFVLYDLEYPFQGGYYYGKLEFPTDYPSKPPSLIFITPNGRFKQHEKICLSFTSFHPESW